MNGEKGQSLSKLIEQNLHLLITTKKKKEKKYYTDLFDNFILFQSYNENKKLWLHINHAKVKKYS